MVSLGEKRVAGYLGDMGNQSASAIHWDIHKQIARCMDRITGYKSILSAVDCC